MTEARVICGQESSSCRKESNLPNPGRSASQSFEESLRFAFWSCQLRVAAKITLRVENQPRSPYRTHIYPVDARRLRLRFRRVYPPLFLERGKARELAVVFSGP